MTGPQSADTDFDLLLERVTLLTAHEQQPLWRDATLGVRDGRIAWICDAAPIQACGIAIETRTTAE
jgi:hypothetical protein